MIQVCRRKLYQHAMSEQEFRSRRRLSIPAQGNVPPLPSPSGRGSIPKSHLRRRPVVQFALGIYLELLPAGALVAGTERFFHSKIRVPQVKRSIGPARLPSATELNRAAVASSNAF